MKMRVSGGLTTSLSVALQRHALFIISRFLTAIPQYFLKSRTNRSETDSPPFFTMMFFNLVKEKNLEFTVEELPDGKFKIKTNNDDEMKFDKEVLEKYSPEFVAKNLRMLKAFMKIKEENMKKEEKR